MVSEFCLTPEQVNELALCVKLPLNLVSYDGHKLLVKNKALAKNIEVILSETDLSIPALLRVKNYLTRKIDEAAEKERLKYITPGAAQALVYQDKLSQAVNYSNNANNKDISCYPLLAAGLGVDGNTLSEVAETITFSYALWQKKSAKIEEVRLTAKSNIMSAKTADEARALYEAIDWAEI